MIYSNNNIEYYDEVGLFDTINNWKTSNENHFIQKFKTSSMNDAEYEKVRQNFVEMKEAEDYDSYRKAFNRFCYFCHIVPRGVILVKVNLQKGKDNKNLLYVEYSYNTKRIDLPQDTPLYHMSKVGGIQELMPVFRGKSAKGYLYDKPRVYFTIRKHFPKFLADYKFNEKMHLYICKENIKQAFVDPLVWVNISGAVYVESNKPIKVEEITKSNIDSFLNILNKKPSSDTNDDKSKSNSINENTNGIDFEDFYSFVSENGLIILD